MTGLIKTTFHHND